MKWKAKIIAISAAILLALCSLTACSDSQEQISASIQQITTTLNTSLDLSEFPAQTNPNVDKFETGYNDFFGMVADQDYSNIICYTDNESYPQDFEKIAITVKNQNVGKGFYLFSIPVIERKINDEWVRLNYMPEDYLRENNKWEFCGIEGEENIPYSTRVTIWADELKDDWTLGEYRAVIFVGKEVIYAPFTIM